MTPRRLTRDELDTLAAHRVRTFVVAVPETVEKIEGAIDRTVTRPAVDRVLPFPDDVVRLCHDLAVDSQAPIFAVFESMYTEEITEPKGGE